MSKEVSVDFENLLMLFFSFVLSLSLFFMRYVRFIRVPLSTQSNLLQMLPSGPDVGVVLSCLVSVVAWEWFFQLEILVMKVGLVAVLWMVPSACQRVVSCPQWYRWTRRTCTLCVFML